MKRILPWNSAVTGLQLQLLLFVLAAVSDHTPNTGHDESTTDHLQQTSIGSNNDSLPNAEENHKYYLAPPEDRKFLCDVDAQREKAASSIMDFKFAVTRIRMISPAVDIPEASRGIMYWMIRDQRVQDNWALLYAQKVAIENKVPLHVVFVSPGVVEDITYRQYNFMCEGLKKVEFECRTLDIEFHFLVGESTKVLSIFARNHSIGMIVVDFSPLREIIYMTKRLINAIGSKIPFAQIDAHNVVPCWLVANKQLGATGAMRRLMFPHLKTYLTEFPPVIKHPYPASPKASVTNWRTHFQNLTIDRTVRTVSKFKAGYLAAMSFLKDFLINKLARYYVLRLNPLVDGLSNLSPYLHFGQISAQRVVLEVMKFNHTRLRGGVRAYEEEILVRRELLENYCFYNPYYDRFEGAPLWGQLTLNHHRNDTRLYVYTRHQLENGQTRDYLWNAAQNQMKEEGRTHRYLRPFWAKKILEFSKSPEDAIATANYLNNKYSLDGNDPLGYAGVLWAITGLHDRESVTRQIFGKIRYIGTMTLRLKFDGYRYIGKYQPIPPE